MQTLIAEGSELSEECTNADPHTMCTVLIRYLGDYEGRLISADCMKHLVPSIQDGKLAVEASIHKLDSTRLAILRLLWSHWKRVLAAEENNRMDAQALATCLFPVLFGGELSMQNLGVCQSLLSLDLCI